MTSSARDPLLLIAGQVADCFSESGYAFIEDDEVEALAAALGAFLAVSGIPVQVAEGLPSAAAPAQGDASPSVR